MQSKPTTAETRRGRPSAAATRTKMSALLRVAREQFVRHGYRAATMEAIAAAAGLTKRTLYLWHGDKAALFRACIVEGAERFPALSIDSVAEPATELRNYAGALIRELAEKNSYEMGLLFLREGRDFPEFAQTVQRSYDAYLVQPLAAYLRKHGLEQKKSTERTRLFLAMALDQVHSSLLLGSPMPDASSAQRHATSVVEFFLSARPVTPSVAR